MAPSSADASEGKARRTTQGRKTLTARRIARAKDKRKSRSEEEDPVSAGVKAEENSDKIAP